MGSEEDREKVYEMFVFIHQSVEKKSAQFLAQMRRTNYVTPTSYLELLTTFQTLLKDEEDWT